MRLAAILIVYAGVLTAQSADQVKVGGLTVTGSVRERVESWSWFNGPGDSNYTFSGSILRLAVGQTRDDFEWKLEFAAPIVLGLPEHASGAGALGQYGTGALYYYSDGRSQNAALVFAKQGYLKWKFGERRQSVRTGRFEFQDGTETVPRDATLAALKRDRVAQRLIGTFNFSHVGRSFDGVQYVYDGTSNLTLMGARPTRGVYQVDGWGEVNLAVGYAALTRPSPLKTGTGEWRVFAIEYDDWRNVVKTDNRLLAARTADRESIRVETSGGNYVHAFETSAGTFDALLWGALQTGKWGRLAHRAGAYAVEGGYQPPVRVLNPWFRGGFDWESGDGNPNDSSHGTFFQILPTPRQYARFPFYSQMNLRDLFGEAILRPHKKVSLRADVHSLSLTNRSDLWYQGGGAHQPWTFGYSGRPSNGHAGLGTVVDGSADYTVNRALTLTAYFAVARGGAVPASIYGSGGNGRFAYLQMLYSF